MSPTTVTYKASAMDMSRSDTRIICGLGPANFGGIERVRARLFALASAGPSARVGLQVTPTSPKWKYRPDLVCDNVIEVDPITAVQVKELLVELSRTASAEVPLRARLAGDYLLLDLSHGFSDAVLPVELYAYLGNPDPNPPLPSWATARAVRNPLPRALADWMIHNPRNIVDVVHGRLRTVPPELVSPALAPMEDSRVPWSPSPALAVASSSVGAPSALTAWRAENLPEVSITSMLSAAVAKALSTSGIPTAYSANFLFDCRRYLRAEGVVLGNFAVGIDFRGIDPTSPTALHSSLAHAIDKGRPLAVGGLSALHYLKTRSAVPSIRATTAPATADAEITFSDIGRVRQVENIAWTEQPDKCVFYPLSEPSIPQSIVVTSMRVRDVFHLTATFHDNFFDRDAVQSAIDLAMFDPIALLAPQELSR
ncbi:hypothetical protein QMK17_18245 [Rhodococcus sp. G-MC3]|uniref:hypothetical protein n=1 Tax=Rhodococcus sp. G-MC3 TaxID=3046209 RepID=UPI0024BABBA6|nr:hypothetical protein [Rhodococcus sp. G-MC3]MDJ0395271.1 hypothetical protein [Rhodococcus sp. G-MC3]